jgi:hypothetical protein
MGRMQEENHRFVKQLDAALEPARLFEHTTLHQCVSRASPRHAATALFFTLRWLAASPRWQVS